MYKVEDSDVCGGYRSFRDIAIQERLLEADDEFIAREILNKEIRTCRWQKNGSNNCNTDGANSNVSEINGGRNNNGNIQKFRAIQVCGWHSDPSVVYRKTENCGVSKSKLATGSLGKDASIARDSKGKTFSSEYFVFQHYLDTNHYIEQYRQKHRCSDNITLSPARSDLSDLRKPHPNQLFSPMTVFTQTIFKPEVSLPSSQLNGLPAQTSDKQNQSQNKSSQVSTTQFASERGQQRQKFKSLKSFKKTYSPSISAYGMSKVMDISDSVPSSSQSERISSAKELVVIPAIIDTPVLKAAANLMKVQTLNIDYLPNKRAKLPKPGPTLDAATGSHLLGYRVGFGATNQTRTLDGTNQTQMLDATAFRFGSGHEKQSSGSQEVTTCPDAHLEPAALAKEQGLNPDPAQLFMTSMHREQHFQTWRPDLNEKLRVSHPLATRSRGNYIFRNSIEMVALENSCRQKVNEKCSQMLGKTAKQNLPHKERSLLTVVGHDCSKTKKFVCDHLARARKQNDKLLLSHNKRIQNLIEQSKLKHKFDQILNISKVPVKNFLKINSIQITDPFVKSLPGNNRHSNSNNSCRAGQNVCSDTCFCGVDCRNKNKVKSYKKKVGLVQRKMSVKCIEVSSQNEEDDCDSTSCYSDSSCIEVSSQNEEDDCDSTSCYSDSSQSDTHKGSFCLNLTTSTAGLEYSSLQASHADMSHADICDVTTHCDQGFCVTCAAHALDGRLQKSKMRQASFNKSYLHRLAQEVPKMEVRLPDLRYSEFPLVCRSHSLDL